jgi:hypothetical protein
MKENDYITHVEYSTKCRFDKNKEFELTRRKYNSDYDNAIKSLGNTTSKTAIYDQYNMYTHHRFMYWIILRSELFYTGRLKRKFESHSVAQSAISHFGGKITKRLRQQIENESKEERQENNRIRRCATVDENNNNSYHFMDRDACGSVNIAQKAIYKILSNDIPHFEFI